METQGPSLLLTIISFIGGFSLLVFIHEWGHFIVARMFKVRVEVFSIGFGKELFGRTDKNGTRWRLAAIPLGGYVKFFGDASAASNPDDVVDDMTEEDKKVCLHYKPLWQRALVVFAGPFINLVFPVLIFGAFAFSYGSTEITTELSMVNEGSAAAKADMRPGDKIVAIDGNDVDRFVEVRQAVMINVGTVMQIDVLRGNEIVTLSVSPDVLHKEDRFGNKYAYGMLGVRATAGDRIEYGVFGALGEGVFQTKMAIDGIFTNLGQLIIGLRSIKEMKGPVGIATMIGEQASQGFQNWIYFLAMISISLGIMNLMPIPVLDGGHLLYYGLEAIKGGPVSKFAQEAGFVAGLALILFLMVIVTLNDLQSLAS